MRVMWLVLALMLFGVLAVVLGWRFRSRDVPHRPTITLIASYPSPSPDEADEAVLQSLRAHGSDLSKPTDIVFYLYIPSLADVRTAAQSLTHARYRVSVGQPAAAQAERGMDSRYPLIAHIRETPTIEHIRTARHTMMQLANRYNGYYDGWEAQLQP